MPAASPFRTSSGPKTAPVTFGKNQKSTSVSADVLLENFARVSELAQMRGVTLRTAAYMLAINRVVQSMMVRGVYA